MSSLHLQDPQQNTKFQLPDYLLQMQVLPCLYNYLTRANNQSYLFVCVTGSALPEFSLQVLLQLSDPV